MKIFVLNGHPEQGSLCDALAQACVRGAREGPHEIRLTNVRELTFDPILRGGFTGAQALEPDLAAQREVMDGANTSSS